MLVPSFLIFSLVLVKPIYRREVPKTITSHVKDFLTSFVKEKSQLRSCKFFCHLREMIFMDQLHIGDNCLNDPFTLLCFVGEKRIFAFRNSTSGSRLISEISSLMASALVI